MGGHYYFWNKGFECWVQIENRGLEVMIPYYHRRGISVVWCDSIYGLPLKDEMN